MLALALDQAELGVLPVDVDHDEFTGPVELEYHVREAAGVTNVQPFVSIIIPTYNRPQTLRRAVMSVLAQTFREFEVIVVDDHSPRPALDGLSGISDDRLVVVRHEANRGSSGARNTGIEAARGAWIAFLDDDDVWLPEKLERQLRFMQDVAPNADASVTDYLDVSTGAHQKLSENVRQKGVARLVLYYDQGFAFGSTLLAKRSVFETVGDFDTRFRRAQDWDWLVTFLLKNRQLAFVPEELMHYSGDHINPQVLASCIRQIGEKHHDEICEIASAADASLFQLYVARFGATYGNANIPGFAAHMLRITMQILKAMTSAPRATTALVLEKAVKRLRQPRLGRTRS